MDLEVSIAKLNKSNLSHLMNGCEHSENRLTLASVQSDFNHTNVGRTADTMIAQS